MIKKMLRVIKKNLFLIVCIFVFLLSCIIVKKYFMNTVNDIDLYVQNFFINKMISDSNTYFMKNITYMGDVFAIFIVLILCFIFFKSKIVKLMLISNLASVGIFAYIIKVLFARPRPAFSLIDMPTTYSFPSGHSLISVGFYGFIIYFLWRTNIKQFLKYILTFIITMVIIFISISRIYLGVHYFSDVIGGLIFGILILILFIRIYLNYEWRYRK